ncbi:uncharacterized protein UV8b_01185 [Ustilaginoidea virens]|uniref:Rab-GAP TBC domain-containing protein n=2 Tax=Ustilaginoidea virens TaxID=1159556 RepID=A0A8E5HK96_USTVR|nr:uncharacterized protein UV8b_01185 [Ustilaginoidea virens]QUC16944.1 hypothetical protein UV8b_01185 [Ustilaginoidea virens]
MPHSSPKELICSSTESPTELGSLAETKRKTSMHAIEVERGSATFGSQTNKHKREKAKGTSSLNGATQSQDFTNMVTGETKESDILEGNSETGPVTPRMAHDSMVTVRLSEPPSLALSNTCAMSNTRLALTASPVPEEDPVGVVEEVGHDKMVRGEIQDMAPEPLPIATTRSLGDELGKYSTDDDESDFSDDNEEVNWEQLEKTEDEQSKDEESDNSTALLLARLEQENAKLATNPKSVKVRNVEKRSSHKPRPPSMAQLQKMVNGPAPAALRYSMLPPPPMTDLEFYAALVKDYQQTAARLPTLLSNKIRKGIPPPLRGVVWQSMSGARDSALEEQYDRFCGESSPYELIIGKDLGRSFPGVDMFRDPDGDGQRMLGRVLKSFSLYDTKIGYCQGLGFLVGPLLMHMPDKQAFCVLVRLMEKYDLRACFLPDLSGLHVRIYQFRELLRLNLPALSSHLEDIQVETAYVSQWFLSFFAVTCPLPMLFRIYDVIFAEGASETVMRVALSLMRKNEARLLACTELEDAMQLLLSRGLWDCYHYNADEFVQDFASLSSSVTREKLSQLEQAYRESLIATANAARASDITTAASRFLGRIWASTSKNSTLSPGTAAAPTRPLSMLRRSTSKQSIASTLNSMEASSESVNSFGSTIASTLSRDSASPEDESYSREATPVGRKTLAAVKTAEERYLHSQIEDLLTALSELQRNHALLTSQLQSEREEREEDRKAVRLLLDGLRKRANNQGQAEDRMAAQAPQRVPVAAAAGYNDDDPTSTTGEPEPVTDAETEKTDDAPSTEDLSELLDGVERRFAVEKRKHRSSLIQSKAQVRDELLKTKDQLATAVSHSQELSRRIHDMDQDLSSLREQLRERHVYVRSLHQDNQRLEKQLHVTRARVSSSSVWEAHNQDADVDWAGKGKNGGLRELKLGRRNSTPTHGPVCSTRVSSLPHIQDSPLGKTLEGPTCPLDHEALLLELVQAKTAEATAKQEAEEAKQKLEALRRAHAPLLSENHGSCGASNSLGAMGVLGRLTGHATTASTDGNLKPFASAAAGASPNTGGFWGWRR